MKNKNNSIRQFINHIISTTMAPWLLAAGGVVLVLIIITAIIHCGKDNSADIYTNNKIDITPNLIESIKDIGEWEFLAVSDEEIVDTVRHGLFGDDQLVRIYYGTLRLGIDLHKTDKNWIRTSGDSVVVTLPPIRLLDDDFIDETRTRAFLESGKWSHQARAALYQKAKDIMMRRCLTESNIRSAEQNAFTQFHNIMLSMGFNHIKIRFERQDTHKKK